ncbi:MAG TPA: hypothetical protein VGG57_05340 [Stellaceae bacterium]|jgi:hypothetical protein
MRLLRFAVFAAVLLATPAASVGARAGTLSDSRVGFSADRTLILDGKAYVGKVWTMPGKERHEQMIRGFQPVFILREDSPIGDIVLAQLHTTVEFVFPAELRLLADPRLTRHPIGHEVVNGIPTMEYAVDETAPQGHAEGTLWLSRDGIPMRCEGTFTAPNGHHSTLKWELSHVKIGPQPDALFEVPQGFNKLPAEALAPLLGLKLKSAKG